MGERFVDRLAALEQVADRKAQPLDPPIASNCIVAERLADLAPAMGEKAQRPRRGDAGSFWRSDPAAALRGLAKILPPAASWRSLSAAKSAFDI